MTTWLWKMSIRLSISKANRKKVRKDYYKRRRKDYVDIHLITYLTSKLFWFILCSLQYHPVSKNEIHKSYLHILYISAFMLGKHAVGTMYGDLIWADSSINYNSGISGRLATSCLEYTYGIYIMEFYVMDSIVFFQRYAVAEIRCIITWDRELL